MNHRLDFTRCNPVFRILLRQECPQICLDQYLLWLALNRLTQHMRIPLRTQKLNNRKL